MSRQLNRQRLTEHSMLVQVGYWKDLLEILVRACVTAEELQERKMLQGQVKNFMKWVRHLRLVCKAHLCLFSINCLEFTLSWLALG